MLSLSPITPGFPQFGFDSAGQVSYTAATEAFNLAATTLTLTTSGTSAPLRVTGTRPFAISAAVDNSGNLAAEPGDGLTIDGSVTVNGTAYTGTLLTGSIADFGTTPDTSGDTPPTETYYFELRAHGRQH